tara:strand:+ start:779 stop:1423 length:645 start_codon:yes stop_codon:yes gene_type:complete
MKNQKEKTEQLKELMYEDSLIHFAFNPSDKDVLVNATEMAKVFNKETRVFLKTDHAKKYIQFLTERMLNTLHLEGESQSERAPNGARSKSKTTSEYHPFGGRSNVKIVDDRGHMGIYFHRKLAIKFAMWLDDEFFDWVIDTIDEILHGKIEEVKSSISKIQTAEEKLETAIEKAKKENNVQALAIIDAYKERESAKKTKDKAMRMFTRQMKMEL